MENTVIGVLNWSSQLRVPNSRIEYHVMAPFTKMESYLPVSDISLFDRDRLSILSS